MNCCASCSSDAVRPYDGGLVLRELSLRRRAVCLRVWLSVCLSQAAPARAVPVHEGALVNCARLRTRDAAVYEGVLVNCCAGCSRDTVRAHDGVLVLRELPLRRRAVCLRVRLSVWLPQVEPARAVLLTRAFP